MDDGNSKRLIEAKGVLRSRLNLDSQTNVASRQSCECKSVNKDFFNQEEADRSC